MFMFTRTFIVLFFVTAFSGLANAVAVPTLDVRQTSQCNTGSINCCNSVQSSSSTFVPLLFGFLGIPVPSPGTQVGFTCSPMTSFGLGSGSSCTSQPVCCNGNSFSGLIVIGCSPININL